MDKIKAKQYAEEAIEMLCKITLTSSIKCRLNDIKPDIYSSKVGGVSYISPNTTIPTDKNGRQMRLLAQFNCCDLISLEDFPHEGILQFWMTTDERLDDFSVLYFEKINGDIYKGNKTVLTVEESNFPVKGEYGIEFTVGEETMSRDDPRLKALFCQCYTEISGEYIQDPEDAGDGEYGEVVYEVFEGYCDDSYGGGTKIGGYEGSAQLPSYYTYRPKEYAERFNSPYKTYIDNVDIKADDATILLFQLDSCYKSSSDYKVMWGDAGVGRFYIKRSDLIDRDFSKVWFSWDCS